VGIAGPERSVVLRFEAEIALRVCLRCPHSRESGAASGRYHGPSRESAAVPGCGPGTVNVEDDSSLSLERLADDRGDCWGKRTLRLRCRPTCDDGAVDVVRDGVGSTGRIVYWIAILIWPLNWVPSE
jgi:hypothetical protein